MQDCEIVAVHAGYRVAIVETVAEGDDDARLEGIECFGKLGQRLARVVGRQVAAAGCGGRCLFEMEIGDDQGAFGRPIERATLIRDQQFTADGKLMRLPIVEVEPFRPQFEHSRPLVVSRSWQSELREVLSSGFGRARLRLRLQCAVMAAIV